MITPKPKQVSVLDVKCSLNIKNDMPVNTVTPIPKPINLEGHIWPSYAVTRYLTDNINK